MSVLSSRLTPIAATLIAIACMAWLIGMIQFAQKVSRDFDIDDTRTEAIVVLTGGSKRIAMGLSLLADGLADKLFISGVGAQVDVSDLLSGESKFTDSLAPRITLGSEAEDTPGNALETAQWTAQEGISSIRLVTASYHMPRSLQEMYRALPNVEIVPHPVFPDQVKADWWRYPGTATLIAGEYTKYLFSGLRIWVSSLFSPTVKTPSTLATQ